MRGAVTQHSIAQKPRASVTPIDIGVFLGGFHRSI
jgi:hypothetical protein